VAASGEPHIFAHGVSEQEVEEIVSRVEPAMVSTALAAELAANARRRDSINILPLSGVSGPHLTLH